MANNYVFEQLRTRIGRSVVVTVDSDSTSFRGKLIGITAEGTDNADSGVSAAANDEVSLVIHVSRQKS